MTAPSTIAELRDVLIAYDASRPRSMQTRLGPSELGTPCQQQMARKLVGAPRRPVTEPTWAPFQGTAVHAEMEKVLEFWNGQLGRKRWIIEEDLHMDDEIHGHGDAYDTDTDCVVDWKHSGITGIKKLLAAKRAGKPPREQVKAEYRVQAHLYGLGHARKGRDVKLVRLVFLARDWQYSSSAEWTEEYNPDIAFWALSRYYGLKDAIAGLNVPANPQAITAISANPGEACSFCPFHRAGQPSGWDGCAGDEAKTERAMQRFADGLIA
jgi:hypothetical protein